ncbi:MAG: lipopolysaccharide heptosyltransferase [Fibrobacteres bacterium]|nr:lipopolysaccharide heptosyltransferase [Fibrobacterota bacterium]
MNGPGAGALLVILPHNPGDVVMALQAIRRVKADFPGTEVDYLAGEECRELVERSPLIRTVRTIPRRALKELWESGDSVGLIGRLESFLGELASVHYSLSANLFQERSGGLIQAFVRADRKIGLELADDRNFQVKSRFLEHLHAIPADRAGNGWHVVDIYARAISRALEGGPASNARQAGEAVPSGKPDRHPASRRAENALAMLPPFLRPEAAKSMIPGEYLVFHPGSAWPGKRWPETHWASLATRCVRAGLNLAFTGAPEERPMMDRILVGMGPGARSRVADTVGATSLAGAAWICANARMVVTGDTVAMHLAAASGIPTLSLFGASNPVETGPYGRGHLILQTDGNPLPDLAFQTEHAGLAHLRADEVAEYLLEGIPPPGFNLWETGWDETDRRQILFDRSRRLHPCYERSRRLLGFLDRDADRSSPPGPEPVPRPAGARGRVHRLLAACASGAAPSAQDLSDLEAAERDLAGETRSDLVWESYRIAVNGLSVRDLRDHLAARFSRFELALKEEAH